MSDVNDDTLEEMDRLVAEGVPDFKLFTAYPGRLLQRRRRDLPGDAADREERRADHDARRERHGHRRRRGTDRRRRARPIRSATASPARRSSRARRPTGSSAWPRRPVSRSTSSTCRPRTRWPRSAPRATGARWRSPRPARSTCSSRSTTWATGSRARSSSARRRSARRTTGTTSGPGLVKDDLQVVSTDHCPFDFHGQKELGRGDFRKVPNGLPGVEDRVDLLHDGGVVGGRITKERWVEIISTAPAKLFGMYPQKGAVASAPTRTSSSTTRTASARSPRRRTTWTSTTRATRGDRSRAPARSCCRAARSIVRDGEFTGRKGAGKFVKRAAADYARMS